MRYENCAGTINKFLFSGFGGAGDFFCGGRGLLDGELYLFQCKRQHVQGLEL